MAGRVNDKWVALRGRADELASAGMQVGFEMPPIVLHGQPLQLEQILDHPRLLSDLRNVFDLAQGKGPSLSGRFWELIRKVTAV